MKRILLLTVFVLALSFGSNAQTYLRIMDPTNGNAVVNDAYITVQGTPGGTGGVGELEHELLIKNISGQSLDIKVTRTELDVAPNTKNTTCWYICPLYVTAGDQPVLESAFTETIADQDTNDTFVAHHRPEGVDGCSLMKYEFWDVNDPQKSEVVYIKFLHNTGSVDCSTLDVAEYNEDLNKVSVYPNPATTAVKINIENNYNITSLVIVDMLGKTVKTIDATNVNGVKSVDVSNLNKGFYFVKVMNGSNILKSKKLMIN
ncbi:MAG: T9SS type A sorting domain-containing protein [Crocinitomicaceae bacterium]|nr:T9SS type A sorting domain-containing protein [Crocinitomicaceae bacterium]